MMFGSLESSADSCSDSSRFVGFLFCVYVGAGPFGNKTPNHAFIPLVRFSLSRLNALYTGMPIMYYMHTDRN